MRFTLIHGTNQARPKFHKKRFGFSQVPVYPPLGVLYLGSMLEQAGYDAEIIDFFIDKDPYASIDRSIHQSDVIGLSVDNISSDEAASLAQYIKNKDADIPIVIGGPYCSLYQERALKKISAADVSVDGDGEHAIINIAKAFEGTIQLSDIPGVFYRKNSGVAHGKSAEPIRNLDDIPFPARHLVAKYEYGKSSKLFMNTPRLTSLATARGCPFRCKYCHYSSVWRPFFRQRCVKNVIAEFHEIIEQGYQSVMFANPVFLAHQKRAHVILDELIAMGSPLELFLGGNRTDITDRTLYEKMRKAGVKYISFGLVSGNQDMIEFSGKHLTVEQTRKVVGLCDELGFFINGSFYLGAPFEDKNHFKNTIDFACSLPLDTVVFNHLAYNYGSDLWKEAYAQGKIYDGAYQTFADKELGLSPFSREEIRRYCRWGMQRFFYRPQYLTHIFAKALKTGDSRWVHSVINELLLSSGLRKN